ncbi:MAG: araC/xylS-type protein [Bacteroidetes bacterium]|nr:araC/xylS-type protein [Bacteroidota bacterium]
MMIDISQVKSFVSSNLKSVRRTQQVATQLNCSLERLKKTFFKNEKVSLSWYIRESRVSRMKERLLTSDAPCKVICLDLGLREDVGSRLFKNSTGMTMEEFRRSYNGTRPNVRRTQSHYKEDSQPTPRLVITEGVITQVLSTSDSKESKQPIRRTGGIWLQGPAS